MKKLFILISIALLGTNAALAQSGTTGSCSWSLSYGTLYISGSGALENYTATSNAPWYSYKSNITSVSIGNSVTSIGNYAFYGCSSLTSITIGNSVTSIGNNAFYGCSDLTSVTIGNSVTSIGSSAFGSSGLTSVIIPNNVTSIGSSAFYNCSDLTSVTISDGVTSIGNYVFSYCSGLTSITIPDGVTSIGDNAFSYCSDLTSITIPDNVTSIGDQAFSYCSDLTSITIPDNVTSIGYNAFSDCSKLTTVDFNAANCTMGSRNYPVFNNCPALSTVNIGNTVTQIPNYAFFGCSGLTSITIPDGVTSIGYDAFYGCSGLTSIIIPDGVTDIWGEAFSGCSGLTSVSIGNSVTDIGSEAFSGCSGLTSITIPDGVTSIGDWVFSGCSTLTTVNFNATNCTTMGRYYSMFHNCPALSTVNIGNNVTNIPNYAFKDCSGLSSVTIPAGVTSIGEWAFADCSGLTSITIPDGVTHIGYATFSGCSGLTSVTISDGVTSIGDWAFSDCSGLTSVAIGNSVTSIGSDAFSGCPVLTSVRSIATIPPSLSSGSFNVNTDTLYVPAASWSDYNNKDEWKNAFDRIATIRIGSGSQASPYLISGKADMATLAAEVASGNSYSGKYFLLTSDLTGDDAVTTSVGSDYYNSFDGIFDGGGHIIEVNNACGVFGYVADATIRNLGVSGTVSTTASNSFTGGICAQAERSTIQYCFNSASVTATNAQTSGGICGQAVSSTISNCYNFGTITITGWGNPSAGGICGDPSETAVSNCYNLGAISASPNGVGETAVGGISGGGNDHSVTNCFAANIALTATAGGAIGRISANNYRSAVSNCYALSTMTANGVIAKNNVNGENGTDAALSSFKSQSWVTANLGWDFNTIWRMGNNGFPVLKVFGARNDLDIAITEPPAPPPTTYTVTFDTNGGSDVTPQQVEENATVTRPDDPILTGYTFEGWYYFDYGDATFDFDTPITGDITLTAQWTETSSAIETITAKLQVYPNPTTDVVHIKNANGAEVKVYNHIGILLHRTNESRIDLSAYPNGVYLLRVGGQTLKVVKK
ncbi:hypothetical protein AGMMS49982_01840 [Bacteroidia bacterium]|nr:hypothetical protein AGMMS49982_01840 [Bacteroidia bacterium]